MRILIATPLFPPDIGGPATYSKILAEELPKRGIEVSLASFGSVRRLPKGLSHLAYFLLTLWRGRNVDIIFAQDPVSVGLPAMWAAKLLKKRFFLKVVGDFAWEQYQIKNGSHSRENGNPGHLRRTLDPRFRGGDKLGEGDAERNFVSLESFQEQKFGYFTELRKKIERYVAREAEKIIVPSEYLKKIVEMWSMPEEKITVIYNAFEPTEVHERRDDLKRRFGIEGPVILTAGRLVPWKGISQLIEVFQDILTIRRDVKLVIVGDGPEREHLESLAREKVPEGSVIFTGRLFHDELLRYVKAADVFVLNSSYEGFSHQLLEVMGIGTPIVATNIGGNPELIESGENGFLVEYGDREALAKNILAVLDISDLQRTFAKNAKETVKSFTKERMVGELIKIL